jgi:hypothetical protein
LHSLFKAINLEIDGKMLTINPQTYAYKAYLESFLGFTFDAKVSHLTSQGWNQEDTDEQVKLEDKAKSFLKPTTISTDGKGKSIELMGKLFLDLAFQPKALIGGVNMKITLIPNDKAFYLWNLDGTITPTVTFEKASLFVSKSKVAQPIVEAHNLALTKGTAKYPITRGYVKAFTINTGSLDVNIDNAFSGQLPKRLFVMLVSNEAFNGHIKKNPYNFEHFNLNYITASIDGIQYPSIAYTPDYANDLYMREFVGLYDTLKSLSTDSIPCIHRKEFSKGNAIYGFDFGNENCEDCHKSGFIDVIRRGSVRVQMRFSAALTENVSALMYAEFDNLIEINTNRQAITDFL